MFWCHLYFCAIFLLCNLFLSDSLLGKVGVLIRYFTGIYGAIVHFVAKIDVYEVFLRKYA